jgi:hypothetical protein
MNPFHQSPAAMLLRDQFQALDSVGAQLSLDEERRRRILLIDQHAWTQWLRFLRNGPLPAQPAVPVMLRRVAAATFRLAAVAERQAA